MMNLRSSECPTARRSWLHAGVALIAVVGLSACSWPQFRGDATHSGYQPFESKISRDNVSTLTEAWTATTAGSVHSSPAVANGVVYVGSTDGKLYALDAAGVTNCSGSPKTCAPLWTATTGGFVNSSPAVANGVVYIGSDDGKLYAFDAAGATNCSGSPKTCTPLWTATTGDSVTSSPAVANGVVYVGSQDGFLYAFDATGATNCSGSPKVCAPLWKGNASHGGGYLGSSPAVANGVVYIGAYSPKFNAFDAAGETNCSGSPKSCEPVWTATTANPVNSVSSSPAVANGVMYIGSEDTKLHAYKPS